jgi:hypothetical protein
MFLLLIADHQRRLHAFKAKDPLNRLLEHGPVAV